MDLMNHWIDHYIMGVCEEPCCSSGVSGGDAERIHTTATQAAHGFNQEDCPIAVYYESGIWKEAQASDPEMQALGVVTSVNDIDTLDVTIGGIVTISGHALDVDQYYFLDYAVPGGLVSDSPPSGISQPILRVLDEDTLLIHLERPTYGDISLVGNTTAIDVRGGSNLIQASGILWQLDDLRSKYLSVNRETFVAQRRKVRDAYLWSSGSLALFGTGYKMIRDGVIVGLTAQSVSTQNWDIQVRKNDVLANLLSVAVTGGETIRDDLNVDFNKGDIIQVFCDTGTSVIEGVIVLIEIAWRLE